MLIVQVEKPENESLASWFEELRTWLDTNGCRGAGFSRAGRRMDRLLYRVSFEEKTKAEAFAARFAAYSPTVRRPTVGEQRDFLGLADAADAPA